MQLCQDKRVAHKGGRPQVRNVGLPQVVALGVVPTWKRADHTTESLCPHHCRHSRQISLRDDNIVIHGHHDVGADSICRGEAVGQRIGHRRREKVHGRSAYTLVRARRHCRWLDPLVVPHNNDTFDTDSAIAAVCEHVAQKSQKTIARVEMAHDHRQPVVHKILVTRAVIPGEFRFKRTALGL